MSTVRRRLTGAAAFALLALLAELTGRSAIDRLDRACHVVPLAEPTTRYYPFLLAGARAVGALVLAGVAWRLVRAHITAATAERLLRSIGQRRRARPQFRLTIDPRLWLLSFATTSLWYLVQSDAEPVAHGRWPLLAPWLHTYSLAVFAVLAVLLSIGWSAVRDWLADVEEYAAAAFAHVRRILRTTTAAGPRRRPSHDLAPRSRFGLAFECRPPPLEHV